MQTVSVKIQINDGGTFKEVTVNADDLANAINSVKDRANELGKNLVDMASLGQIFEGLSSAVNNLHGYISNLTSDYKAASEAETKLATAMRNTMDAADNEIQSIKDFCDEQERMGVVAGDVQMSAAQELATYLEFSDSLKTLIPVVNDMTVQQYGLGASAESATQIATMLGKVMNGQTKALSRYGYEFTEAQEAVLLYGNEAERAAMLAEVVGQSVGGMNREMAKTPVGMMQQAENRLGKMREQIGALVIQFEPLIRKIGVIASSTADIVKVAQAFEAVRKSTLGAKAASVANAAAMKVQTLAARMLGVAEYSAATATKALKWQMAALEATITLGVSVAITALVSVIGKLISKGKQVDDTMEEIDEATEAYGRAAGDARGQIMLEIGALGDIIEKHKKDKDKVQELNEKYGEAFGYHKTAAEWYDILTTKSEDYCRQLGYEAKAKLLASQYGEALVNLDEARKTVTDMEKNGTWAKLQSKVDIQGSFTDEDNPAGVSAQQYWKQVETEEYKAAKAALNDAESAADGLKAELDACTAAGKAAAEAVGGVVGGLTPNLDTGDKLKGLPADLESYRQSVTAAIQVNENLGGSANETDVKLGAMKSGIESLINKYGAENAAVQGLIKEYHKLNQARASEKFGSPLKALPGIGTAAVSQQVLDDKHTRALGLTPALPDLAGFGKDVDKANNKINTLYDTVSHTEEVRSAISGIGDVFKSLGDIIGEQAGAWLEWAGNVVNSISQVIPSIITLIGLHRKETTTAVGATIAKGASSVADVPIAGPALAVAAAATILAALLSAISSVPKFASGAIAYGPTLGLFGEYAGASSNPEVVAPLDKLKGLIFDGQPTGGVQRIELFASGRNLERVIELNRSLRRRG